MKVEQLKIQLEQLAGEISLTLRQETDTDPVCRLIDAQEYLRRAWHALDGSPFEDNDTTIETDRAMKANP